ncbi:SRPBCC family protein [Microbacterium sp. X-17]|uniref:SRPBCC family protein n=1 Tax=Microbacterium sp. X-17 TaxID=3144404 RepID=UPI0031F5AEE8
MPVTDVTTDAEALTMTLVAEFAAPVERVFAAFTDPRQLERFWGPPGYPATFAEFDFAVGGHANYYMTSPKGERFGGAWQFLAIDAPNGFEVLDEFADDDGQPIEGMPASRMVFHFEPTESGTRLTNTSHLNSATALEQILAMGAAEGSRMAMDQLDRVLQGLREYAQGKGTRTEILDDQHVRITRLVEGPIDLVWRAYHEPELLKRWLLGPDGWEMTVCEVEPWVGGRYRYAWAPVGDTEGQPFGFDGETLVLEAPRRAATTEHMTGTDYPTTLNDLNLYEEDGATLVTTLVEYPDRATRDMVLATGMTDGMEASYARLEGLIADQRLTA